MLTPPDHPQDRDPEDDHALFLAAVRDVDAWEPQPLPLRTLSIRQRLPRRCEEFTAASLPPISDTQAAALALMGEEEVRFHRPGISQRHLRQLAKGPHPGQPPLPYLDLHGLRLDAARSVLLQWVDQLQAQGHTQALLIHGKGHPQRTAPMKTHATGWRMQHPAILALCSAQPRHGGRGALYVLLRRRDH